MGGMCSAEGVDRRVMDLKKVFETNDLVSRLQRSKQVDSLVLLVGIAQVLSVQLLVPAKRNAATTFVVVLFATKKK